MILFIETLSCKAYINTIKYIQITENSDRRTSA